jgi:hypothetical protein
MIIRHNFGYGWRHKIYYDTDTKRGTLTLWSSYSSVGSEAEAAEKAADPVSEFFVRQGALREMLFGINRYTELQLGDEEDLLSLLAAVIAVKMGEDYSFMSREGRRITLSLEEVGSTENVIVNVKVQYGKEGKLSLGEAGALAAIIKEILIGFGYSRTDIVDGVENASDS